MQGTVTEGEGSVHLTSSLDSLFCKRQKAFKAADLI